MKRLLHFFAGADIWRSRLGVMTLVSFLSLIWFVIDWCTVTTFRPLSDWILWSFNILAALIITLPYLFSCRIWVQALCIAAVDMLLLSDIMYCRTYFTSIPIDNFSLIGNLADFTSSIYKSTDWMDLGFPIILIAGIWWALHTRKTTAKHGKLRYFCVIAFFAVTSIGGVTLRGGFYKEYDRLVQSCYYSTCGTPTYTFAGHVVYSLMDQKGKASTEAFPVYEQWLD